MAEGTSHEAGASPDRPIESASEDLLGRGRFATELARTIQAWKQRDSLVLGLAGPWGTGKSSVVNLVVEELGGESGSDTVVIRYNPWEWSGQDRIMEGFFSVVAQRLNRDDNHAALRGAAQKWESVAAAFDVGTAVFDGPSRLLQIAASLVGGGLVLAVIAGWTLNDAVSSTILLALGILIVALPALTGYAAGVARSWAKLRALQAKKSAPSLAAAKADLREALGALRSNILVVLDDVDRLTPPQMLQIFQLVKANADFPNLVFLLVYERDVVVAGIAEAGVAKADEFLDKIVQLQFDVPAATQRRVHQLLFRGLDRLLAKPSVSRTFDRTRWANIYQKGLRDLFRTPRDVKRYLNTLEVNTATLHVNDFLEVNAIDLIALEAIRVFEPALYRGLRESKALLTTAREPSFGGAGDAARRAARKAQAEALVEAVGVGRSDQVREVLQELFPSLRSVFGNMSYGQGYVEQWTREVRVCSVAHFDKYFTLSLSEDEIARGEIEALIQAAEDLGKYRAVLRGFKEEERLEALLDRLEAYKEHLPTEHARSVVTGLFDVSDALSSQSGFFSLSPQMHLVRIVYHFTKGMDEGPRSEVLRQAILETEGLAGPVHYLMLDLPNPERSRETPSTLVETDQHLCKEHLLDRIRAAAADGSLWTHPDFLQLMWRWFQWTASPGEVPEAVWSRLDGDLEDAMTLIGGLSTVGQIHTAGNVVATERLRLDVQALRDFIGKERLLEVVERLSSEKRTDVEMTLLREARALAEADFPDNLGPRFLDLVGEES